MTRRSFLGGAAAFAAMDSMALSSNAAAISASVVAPRNRHPYAGIDWQKAIQVKTTSHCHIKTLKGAQVMIKSGYEFLTLSNYHPSAPVCPLKGLPSEILEAPNAEHWGFTDPVDGRVMDDLHMCSPGSAYASGERMGLPWDQAIPRLLSGLVYPEGGGVTINHPHWSHIKYNVVTRLLDVDPRVLGIEVYNCTCGKKDEFPWSEHWSTDYWDHALATGRQCFGFSVPDWSVDEGGFNVLIVPERTVRACLAAYRQGNFYGAVYANVAKFISINFDGRVFAATTDVPCTFELVSHKGVITSCDGTSFSWRLPKGSEADHIYLRLRARPKSDSREVLFTQPQMLEESIRT